jgi:peptidoglycan/LPS O-acetylase OafA/YrhL
LKSIRYKSFDGLRAYFVILVFFTHFFSNLIGRFGMQNYNTLESEILKFLSISNYGVYGFFALSGFLMSRIYLTTDFREFKFIKNRFMRIYPAFFVSILISGLLGIYLTGYIRISFIDSIKNLFFLNGVFMLGEIPSLNFVTWSLAYEFIFYIQLVIISILNKSKNRVNFALYHLLATTIISTLLIFGSSYYFFYFGLLLGLFSDEALRKIGNHLSSTIFILGYLSSVILYSLEVNNSVFFLNFAFWVTFLLIISEFKESKFRKILCTRFLQYLGQRSYSFYLWHALIIILFFWSTKDFTVQNKYLFSLVGFTASFVITLLMSHVSFYLLEKPYFKRKTMSREFN